MILMIIMMINMASKRHKSINIIQSKGDDVIGLRLKMCQYLISKENRAINLEL